MDNIGFSEVYKNKRILKKHITIDSKQRDKQINSKNKTYSDPNDYVIPIHKYSRFKNVISVRVIEAMIPNSQYIINENNKWIDIILPEDSKESNIPLTVGNYTFSTLGAHILTKLGGKFKSVVLDNVSTRKTTIEAKTFDFTLLFKTGKNAECSVADVLGFTKDDIESVSNIATSDNAYHLNATKYVDIQIDEIPDIGNTIDIRGEENRQILKRIPMDVDFGQEKFYNVTDSDRSYNYFTPIELSKLTIKIYNDLGYIYDSNKIDNYIILQIEMLQDEAPDNMGFNPVPTEIDNRFIDVVDTNKEEKNIDYYDIDIKNIVKTELKNYIKEDLENKSTSIKNIMNDNIIDKNIMDDNIIDKNIMDDNIIDKNIMEDNIDVKDNIDTKDTLLKDNIDVNNIDTKDTILDNIDENNTINNIQSDLILKKITNLEDIKELFIENKLLISFLSLFVIIIFMIKKKR